MKRWHYLWRKLQARIWFRASLYAAFGVAAALIAVIATPFVPQAMADRLGGESVEQILTILASSLLAVATFSLGAWVSAYTAVSQAGSPRVASLVTSDVPTQKSLATFVGAFLYAVVAVTAVNARYYGPEGRAVIYLTSLVVVGLVAFRLLAWINRLASLARLSHMIELVEDRTADALKQQPPCLSGSAVAGAAIHAAQTGYIQNIDLARLQDIAEKNDLRIEIVAPVGAFRRRGEVIGRASCAVLPDETEDALRSAYSVARGRTFEQDPRFGLIVLAEIAARALSPGVNDPGTAIQIIGVAVRLLDDWAQRADDGDINGGNDRVVRPALEPGVLLDDAFGPIIRYGSSDLAVAVRAQKGLRALANSGPVLASAAAQLGADAEARAKTDLPKQDRTRFLAMIKPG